MFELQTQHNHFKFFYFWNTKENGELPSSTEYPAEKIKKELYDEYLKGFKDDPRQKNPEKRYYRLNESRYCLRLIKFK
jgi:hypothetical protein